MIDNNNRSKSHQRTLLGRRRVLTTIGATGLSSSLAGCFGGGGGDEEVNEDFDTDEEVTLQWAVSEEENEAADELVEALYEAGMPENIQIDFLAGGQLADERQEQYNQWLSAGRSEPDLLRMDNGWTIPFIERDQLLNLSDNLSDEELTQVDEEYFEMATETARGADGDLFGVPLWVGLPTMLYRKDLVEDAGYDPEGENWATESISWEEFSQVVADIQEANGLDTGYVFQGANYEGLSCCNFNEFMTSWGGAYFGGSENLFGPVGDRPITVDEEPVYNALRMVQQFIYGESDGNLAGNFTGGISPEQVLQMTEAESADVFSAGNAVALRNWPFFVGQFGADEVFGEDLGVMPIPYGVEEGQGEYEGTGGIVGALGGQHLTVNPNSEKLPAALEFVSAAMSEEFNLAAFEALGQIPPKPSVLDSERARNVPVVGRYLDTYQAVGDNAMPRPVTVAWPDQSTAIADEVNTTFGMNKMSEDAMSELASTLEQIEEESS